MRDATEPFEPVHRSSNVLRDLGHPDAEELHLKPALDARIIGVRDDRKLTVREAAERTGVAATDFSRIRRARLDRFTIDRLMTVLARLDQPVEVTIRVRPDEAATPPR